MTQRISLLGPWEGVLGERERREWNGRRERMSSNKGESDPKVKFLSLM